MPSKDIFDILVVVDVQLVVDRALLMAGIPRQEPAETRSVWDAFGTTASLKGDAVVLRPVLSRHIVDTATAKLTGVYGMSAEDVDQAFAILFDLVGLCGGAFDDIEEDYKALRVRATRNAGTGTEDEAVLACVYRLKDAAPQAKVALATRDRDLGMYAEERGVTTIRVKDFALA